MTHVIRRTLLSIVWARWLQTATISSGIVACSCSYPLPEHPEHVIAFTEEGLPVENDCAGSDLERHFGEHVEPTSAFDQHLAQVVAGMTDFQATGRPGYGRPTLVFIHGGLNTYEGAYSRVNPWLVDGALPESSPAYPVFVCWNSSLASSYRDHVWCVRQGESSPWIGPPTSPVFIASDIGRAILRAPFVWSSQAINFGEERLGSNKEFDRYGDDCETMAETVLDTTVLIVTFPVKMVSTLFVDALGTSSWEMMLRRTRLLFAPEDSASGRELVDPRAPFVSFLGELAKYQRSPHRLQSGDTLVAHSMGAIVANRMLQLAVARPGEFPAFQRVVYVAPACSVSECLKSLVPYLEKYPTARLDIVGLHPKAERNETYAWDLAPRGTLLDWLDQFLDKPLTPRDRVVGKLVNAIPAREEFGDALSSRVRIWGGDFGCSCDSGTSPASETTDSDSRRNACESKQTHAGISACVLDHLRRDLDLDSCAKEIGRDEVHARYAVQLTTEIEGFVARCGSLAELEDELTRPEQESLRKDFTDTLRRFHPLVSKSLQSELDSQGKPNPPLDRWIEQVAGSRAINGPQSEPPIREALTESLGTLLEVSKQEAARANVEAPRPNEAQQDPDR